MRAQIGGLAQAQRNAQDGVSLVQTAEGALNEVHSMLQRVRDLKVQYDNGTLSTDDKNAIAAEVKPLADGDQGHRRARPSSTASRCSTARPRFTFQVGANDGETIATTAPTSAAHRPPARRPDELAGVRRRHATALSRAARRRSTTIDNAIKNVSTARADFGAVQNRLEHRLNNLATYQENLVASESRIRDVDMASEMVNFTKLHILQQAGTSMLAQANQAPQSVLSLLR